MRRSIIIFFFCLLQGSLLLAQEVPEDSYTYRAGDRDGIGKWYMGREIAHVMGFQGIGWLERSEREKEERTSVLIKSMAIGPTDVIADIGAGSGYHVFKMAKKAKEGMIYGVDVQEQMLDAMRQKIEAGKFTNIKLIKGDPKSTQLPVAAIDKVLMVDVYHEFSHPVEMMRSIVKSLKPNGKVFLVEYRGEDPAVPIKRLHKMTETQAVKEMAAVGLRLEENISDLPWQHCMVFTKE